MLCSEPGCSLRSSIRTLLAVADCWSTPKGRITCVWALTYAVMNIKLQCWCVLHPSSVSASCKRRGAVNCLQRITMACGRMCSSSAPRNHYVQHIISLPFPVLLRIKCFVVTNAHVARWLASRLKTLDKVYFLRSKRRVLMGNLLLEPELLNKLAVTNELCFYSQRSPWTRERNSEVRCAFPFHFQWVDYRNLLRSTTC